MAFEKKKTYQGVWECSRCGTEINELPFKPDPNRTDSLVCVECYKEGGAPSKKFEENKKEMHKGDWQCSMCGGKIDKLPFKPSSTNNLKCFDCYKKSS